MPLPRLFAWDPRRVQLRHERLKIVLNDRRLSREERIVNDDVRRRIVGETERFCIDDAEPNS